MNEIRLPRDPGPAQLWVFALATGAIASSALCISGYLAGMPGWRWIALAGTAPLLLALVSRRAATRAYTAWNALAAIMGSAASHWVLLICYVLVLGPTRLAGRSSLGLRRPRDDVSGWFSKSTLSRDRYGGTDAIPSAGGGANWLTSLLSYSRARSEWWAIWLIPYLGLFMLFSRTGHPAAAAEPSGDIYTLY